MLITNTITMAIDRQQMPPVIDAVQGDANSRAIKIKLTNGGKPWNVPDGASCLVRFGKPDKTGGIYDTLEDGSSAALLVDGYLQIVLAKQVVSVPGNVFLQVEITSNEASLATFAIIVRVQEDPSIGTMESEDYINLSGYVLDEVHRILKEGGFGGSGTFWVHATLDYEAGTAEVVESVEEIYAAHEANMNCCMQATVTNPVSDGKQILVLQTAEKSPTANGAYYRITFHQLSSYEERSEGTGEWVTRAVLYEVVVSKFDDEIQNVCFRTRVLTDDDQAGSGNVDLSEYAKKDELPKTLPNPHALTIDEQTYDGSEAKNMTAAVEAVVERKMMSVKRVGAKGDGETDDTVAFQNAMRENRVVYVPGGTYKLSGELVIRENCCLELSQDTVLQFTQTSGNAITLLRLAHLKGNHATIFVPYTFSGNVINASTVDDEAALDYDRTLTGQDLTNAFSAANKKAVPPFTHWDPQWKMSRYVTDINICKKASTGVCYSKDGTTYGTAVYLHCDEDDRIKFMWGVSMSGIRISGAFDYGIHAYNKGDHINSWNHDMLIEAVIDGCKIGVLLDNCRYARLTLAIQGKAAENGTAYAHHGIKLVNSRGVDLSRTRVWDWNATNSLWTPGGEYQFLALFGECRGLILDAFQYYEVPTYDIRDLIYTDTPSNLEQMTILQEPIDRWFKMKDGVPYCSDGSTEQKLLTADALDPYFQVDTIKDYTDVLATAKDTDGVTIFNGIGYKRGVRFASLGSGTDLTDSSYYTTTGFIPVAAGDTIYGQRLRFFATSMTYAGIVFYDKNRARMSSLAIGNVINGNDYQVYGYTETSNGFSLNIHSNATMADLAYIRIVFPTADVGDNPAISVNEPIKEKVAGFLADDVKVKAENVVGNVGGTMETGAIILPETTLDGEDGQYTCVFGGDGLVNGETCEVTYNGQKYLCTIREQDDGFLFGHNPGWGKDKGIPFVCGVTEGILVCMPLDGATSVTLSIAKVTVHPIAERLLANGRYEVAINSIGLDGTTASRNYDDIVAALHSGRQVVLTAYGEVFFGEYQVVSWGWIPEAGLNISYLDSDGNAKFINFPNGTWTPTTA